MPRAVSLILGFEFIVEDPRVKTWNVGAVPLL